MRVWRRLRSKNLSLLYIGSQIRKLSLRECARMQGFPENFKVTVTSIQAITQFGNSVTINVVVHRK